MKVIAVSAVVLGIALGISGCSTDTNTGAPSQSDNTVSEESSTTEAEIDTNKVLDNVDEGSETIDVVTEPEVTYQEPVGPPINIPVSNCTEAKDAYAAVLASVNGDTSADNSKKYESKVIKQCGDNGVTDNWLMKMSNLYTKKIEPQPEPSVDVAQVDEAEIVSN